MRVKLGVRKISCMSALSLRKSLSVFNLASARTESSNLEFSLASGRTEGPLPVCLGFDPVGSRCTENARAGDRRKTPDVARSRFHPLPRPVCPRVCPLTIMTRSPCS